MQNREFIVSSSTVKGYDAQTGAFMFSGEALMDSGINVSMSSQEVRGGFGNAKQFEYYHSREMEINITSSTWEIDYLALNVGQLISHGADSVYMFDECITLVAGAGTVSKTPVGDLYVKKPNGAVVQVTPTGSNFTVSGLTTETVNVTYRYSTTIDKIVIDAGTAPKIVRLVMQNKIFDNTGQIGIMEVEVPSFQVSGNFELALTADGVVSTALTGKAIAYNSGACGGAQQYATVRIIPTVAGTESLAGIAAMPATATLTVASPTVTASVIALPSSATRSNYAVANTACTFVSGTPAVATVNASGVITRVSDGTSLITVTYSGQTDVIAITCTA